MSENTPQNSQEESFEKMLEQSLKPQSQFTVGDHVSGKVVFISGDYVFVNISGKSEAVIETSELRDKNGHLSVSKGDEISAYVVSTSGGEIRLTTSIGQGTATPELLRTAFRDQIPVTGHVSASLKGGFSVSVSGINCFCPISQIDRKVSDTPDDYLYKSFQFLIVEYAERGRNIVLSRRALLDKIFEERKEKLLKSVKVGDTIAGTITSLHKYGVTVDLDGIEAFIPKSEISWSRQPDLSRLKAGEKITAKILEFDESGRMVLSRKQMLPDPWLDVDKFSEVQCVNGRVVNIIKNGAFVEIEDGIEGFLPVNRMSLVKKINKPEDILTLNETIQVKILEIRKSEKKMLLELITDEADPWISDESSFLTTIHLATIESSRPNGLTLRLENGMEGFVPKSELLKNRGDIPSQYPTGSSIKVAVKEFSRQERKLVLSERGAISLQESNEFHAYQGKLTQEADSSTLGSIFKDRFSDIQKKIKNGRQGQ